ncbi:CRNS1 synthase, partial [Amia calva]|nr:CRNS1 synthase [Amia calva]
MTGLAISKLLNKNIECLTPNTPFSLSLLSVLSTVVPSLQTPPHLGLGEEEKVIEERKKEMDKGVEQEKRMEWGWQWRQGGLYQELQEALNELELPPTLTDTPKSALSYSELCVCVLGSPLPFLSLLLQMGCRSPGDSLLCLSPSWLSRPSSSSSPNDSHLLVHRAVIFDLGGRTHLLTFIPPRRVTYFLPCAPWVEVGPQQQEVIRNLGCPMGGSPELYRFWGDTLNCRKILGREGLLPTPPTLAVVIQEERESKGEGERGLWVLGVGDVAEKGDEERVREELMHFLNMPAIRATGKVSC